MAPKQTRDTTSNELYVAEKLGVISGELCGIKKDLQELKDAIIPLRRRVYMISGGIGITAFVVTVISRAFVNYLMGQ